MREMGKLPVFAEQSGNMEKNIGFNYSARYMCSKISTIFAATFCVLATDSIIYAKYAVRAYMYILPVWSYIFFLWLQTASSNLTKVTGRQRQ